MLSFQGAPRRTRRPRLVRAGKRVINMSVSDQPSREALHAELAEFEAHVERGERKPKAQARAEKALNEAAQLSFAQYQQQSSAVRRSDERKTSKRRTHTTSGASAEATSLSGPAKVDSLKATEESAKRRIAELQRQLDQTRVKARLSEVDARNHAVGEAIRAHARNDRLKQLLEGATAASDEEMRELSEAFNGRMCELLEAGYTPKPSPESWTRLFRLVDVDGSGQISFDELTRRPVQAAEGARAVQSDGAEVCQHAACPEW